MRQICWLPPSTMVNMVLKLTPVNFKNTTLDLERARFAAMSSFKKILNLFNTILILVICLLTSRKMKPKSLLETKKMLILWKHLSLLNNGRRIMTMLIRSLTLNFQLSMTLEIFKGMTSWMIIETRDHVDPATRLDLLKQLMPGWTWNMVLSHKMYHHNKLWTATSWSKVVKVDGLILMHTSMNMLIWSLKTALHTLELLKNLDAPTGPNANQSLKFKTPISLVADLPKFLRNKWWKTS